MYDFHSLAKKSWNYFVKEIQNHCMRGLGVACNNEHYQITIDVGNSNSQHEIFLILSAVEKLLINLYNIHA